MNTETVALPFLALYAETHFRFFRFFPSYLFRKQPEILFDIPRRVEAGHDVPVLLIINDIDRFPVDITHVSVSVSQNGMSTVALSLDSICAYEIDHRFRFQSAVYLFEVPHSLFSSGVFHLNGKVTFRQRNRLHTVINDNLPTSSKLPFTGFIASNHLPAHSWCAYGDLHVHSQYSQSHVEFGPPISIIDHFAAVSGLSFIGITDHSYDLECALENYLQRDPAHKRWNAFVEDIDNNRKPYRTRVICGEELSVLNCKKKVVHLGALGVKSFIQGSLDGARNKSLFSTDTDQNYIPQALDQIKRQGGISFAAHPGARCGFLHSLLLHRGRWHERDTEQEVDAFQAVNSGFSRSWYAGRTLWINALLKGKKLPLIAGNDAHGDFNRYRAIDIPFIKIYEHFSRHFGCARTGIYGKNHQTVPSILVAIKEGRTFVTTGPFLCISADNSIDKNVISHTPLQTDQSSLCVIGTSTDEYGTIEKLRVFRGYYNLKKEKIISMFSYNHQELEIRENITPNSAPGYIRAELICRKSDGTDTMAVTSPCYI